MNNRPVTVNCFNRDTEVDPSVSDSHVDLSLPASPEDRITPAGGGKGAKTCYSMASMNPCTDVNTHYSILSFFLHSATGNNLISGIVPGLLLFM